MALVFLCLGWLVGLYLGLAAVAGASASDFPLLGEIVPWIVALVALALLAAVLGRNDRKLWVAALAAAMGVLGGGRVLAAVPQVDPLSGISGRVMLQGTVSGRPEPRDTTLLFTLEVDRIAWGASSRQLRGRVLVRTDRYGDWSYGDRVSAVGELRPVEATSGYWAAYLARQGIHATMEYPSLRLLERPKGTDIQRWVDGVRGRLDALCGRLLPEPQASLLAGILVGSRAAMPPDFRDALNATSTSHIVAVSGFNVTLVAGVALMVALRFLSRRKATLLAILLVWLYSLLTGLPPSAARAAIMATLALLAVLVGRGGDTLSFLCLSAAVMAGLEPGILYDLGFQLSFLATAGLVLLEPVLRGWLGCLPGWLAGSLSVTLAAQLATLPILVGNFHTISLISPLSNLLIAPALPWLMGTGGVTVALGAISEPLGQAGALFAWFYLTYLVEVIRWTAQLPGAGVPTGNLEIDLAMLYYAMLLGIATWPLPEARGVRVAVSNLASRSQPLAVAAVLALTLGLAALSFSGRPDGRTHVYFLDVGQGDATLIRGPAGHQILVDGGSSPMAITSSLGRHVGLLDRGLDLVVLTGYDEDRLAGLLEVARRHPIGQVLAPASDEVGRAGRAWLDLLQERGVPMITAAAGQRIDLGGETRMEVLWAPTGQQKGQPGAMAVRLEASGVGILLMGDLPKGVQPEVVRGRAERAEVLRLPSHGAAGSLDERFLQTVQPRLAVLSVRAGNRQDQPAQFTLDAPRGATLLRTDLHGTVEVAIGRDGYEVFIER